MGKITLKIDNRDLAYTIDTYGMFTGGSVEEMEEQHYIDEYGIDPESIDFEYDHAGAVKSLAEASINILWNELREIVENIQLIETNSPRFYNYTTDSYVAEWTINADRLQAYVTSHANEFEEFVDERWAYEYTRAVAEDDVNTQTVVALDFWTRQVLPEDTYNDQMFEAESEAWFEHITPSEEMEKAIKGGE